MSVHRWRTTRPITKAEIASITRRGSGPQGLLQRQQTSPSRQHLSGSIYCFYNYFTEFHQGIATDAGNVRTNQELGSHQEAPQG